MRIKESETRQRFSISEDKAIAMEFKNNKFSIWEYNKNLSNGRWHKNSLANPDIRKNIKGTRVAGLVLAKLKVWLGDDFGWLNARGMLNENAINRKLKGDNYSDLLDLDPEHSAYERLKDFQPGWAISGIDNLRRYLRTNGNELELPHATDTQLRVGLYTGLPLATLRKCKTPPTRHLKQIRGSYHGAQLGGFDSRRLDDPVILARVIENQHILSLLQDVELRGVTMGSVMGLSIKKEKRLRSLRAGIQSFKKSKDQVQLRAVDDDGDFNDELDGTDILRSICNLDLENNRSGALVKLGISILKDLVPELTKKEAILMMIGMKDEGRFNFFGIPFYQWSHLDYRTKVWIKRHSDEIELIRGRVDEIVPRWDLYDEPGVINYKRSVRSMLTRLDTRRAEAERLRNLEQSAKRVELNALAPSRKLVIPEVEGWKITQLLTVDDYENEGQTMHHCIAGYGTQAILQGNTYNFHVDAEGYALGFTLQVGSDLKLIQALGVCNANLINDDTNKAIKFAIQLAKLNVETAKQ